MPISVVPPAPTVPEAPIAAAVQPAGVGSDIPGANPIAPLATESSSAELPFRLDDWDGAETARTITAFCRESTLMQPECERLHAAVVAQINKERLAMVTVLNVCRDKIKNSKGFACKLARHGPGIAPGEEEEVVVDRNRVLRMTDMDRAKVNWRYELPVPGLE